MRRRRAALGIVGEATAGAGIGSSGIAVRRSQRLRDVGARAEARVDQAASPELLQRLGVGVSPLRLDQYGLGPFEAEPAQVLIDAVDQLRAATRLVEILDPQQEFLAAGRSQDG